MRWTEASLVAALVVFGAISAEAQTRTGHARTATMTISVTVVRSDSGPRANARPDSESTSLAPETTAAPTPTANPSTQPVAAQPRQSESAIAVVGSSSAASTATRVFTINF
jgi:hypothetical protein